MFSRRKTNKMDNLLNKHPYIIKQEPPIYSYYNQSSFLTKLGNVVLAFLIATLLVVAFLIASCQSVRAEEIYSDEAIANAIFKSEGSYKAKYLYGIRSVPYSDEAEARRICLNTIRNQRRRHKAHSCGLTYLECLAKRYCPVGAKNDPKGLNRNWLNNVRYFLRRGEK